MVIELAVKVLQYVDCCFRESSTILLYRSFQPHCIVFIQKIKIVRILLELGGIKRYIFLGIKIDNSISLQSDVSAVFLNENSIIVCCIILIKILLLAVAFLFVVQATYAFLEAIFALNASQILFHRNYDKRCSCSIGSSIMDCCKY